jgi:hypothetical protein
MAVDEHATGAAALRARRRFPRRRDPHAGLPENIREALREQGPRKRTIRRREELWAWLFIAPWLLGFLIWYLGPMLVSLYYSFTRRNGPGSTTTARSSTTTRSSYRSSTR